MSTRRTAVVAIAQGLAQRTKRNLESAGEEVSDELAARLELILVSATDIHLRRLAGDDAGAEIEERILKARFANFRSSITTTTADVFNDTIEDAFMSGASVLISLF
jgi:hypothetical protein